MHSMSARPSNRAVTMGVASGGVLVGHWLVYLIVSRAPAARGALLAETGHAYLGAADGLGLAVALAAFATIFLGRMTRRGDLDLPLVDVGVRLAGFQIAAFVAMEVTERVTVGAPIGQLAHGPVLPLGVVVQAVVALFGALAIRSLCRVADLEAAALGATPPLRRGASEWLPILESPRPDGIAVPVRGGRAPPSTP